MEERKYYPGPLLRQITGLHESLQVMGEAFEKLKTLDEIMLEVQIMMSTFSRGINEGVALIQENKIIWANQACSNITGYSEGELMEISPRNLAPPSYRDKYEARLQMFMAGGTIEMPEEWPILRKDRTLKYVNAFSYKVNFMSKPALLIYFYDITESKKIQDEISVRQLILDSINDSVFLQDETGRIVYVNAAMCQLTGYARDELLKMNMLDVTTPEMRKKFDIRVKQFSEKKEVRYNSICLCKDDSRVPIEIRARLVRLGGKPLGLGVAREISSPPPA